MVLRLTPGLLVAIVGLAVGACSAEPGEPSLGTSLEAITAATCVTIQRGRQGAVADTFVKANALRVNYGTQPVLRVSDRDETLLAFDLSPIPSGAAVTSATLKLFVNGENGDGTVLVHRVLVPWQENTVTFASFRQRFAHDAVAAFRVESRQALKSIDLTPLVTKWLGGTPNHGILLEPGPDHRPDCRRHGDEDRNPTLFISSDARHASRRPALEVCYALPVDHCASVPCENGGTCSNAPDGYSCHCSAGYAGMNCEENVDDCSSNPCQNGGLCSDAVGTYACQCQPGFAGENCETNVDDCASEPCLNGGVCSDGVDAFTCICPPGYDGTTCETVIDNCVSEPCHNGGVCTSSPGGYACTCGPGYTGTNCDINVDDCVGNACVNGTCVDGLNAYTCACAPDWGGEWCNVNLNGCGQAPCLNGGTCTNMAGGYVCACARGFTGTNCEVDVNDCANQPCQNGSVCVDAINGFSCSCPQAVDDGNPCTVDSCDPGVGVRHDPVADGTACSDSRACTSGGTCQAGTCAGVISSCETLVVGSLPTAVAIDMHLVSHGYVTVRHPFDSLPADLSFGVIWVHTLQVLSLADLARLQAFVTSGGGVYINGEHSTCCTNTSSNGQALVDGTVADHLVVGDPSFIGNGLGITNTTAINGIALTPYIAPPMNLQAFGRILNVRSANQVVLDPFGSVAAAAWREQDMVGDRGRIVIVMDTNWPDAEGGAGSQWVANFQYFLRGALGGR